MSAAVDAAPTPVPGGANQVSAISGTFGQTIFNGVLRVNVSEVRAATPVDVPTADYTHANLNIQQGAAQRQVGVFAVDKDFVPTKLIVKCVTCGAKTFRTLRISIPHPPQ
jgi:hypothetical protein